MVEAINNEIMESIKKYFIVLKSKNIKFNRAIIFGSFPKGNYNENSDIDLALISDKWLPDRIEARAKLFSLTWGIDTRIEPHPFNEEDFNSSNMLADEIIKHGIEIDIN